MSKTEVKAAIVSLRNALYELERALKEEEDGPILDN